MLKFEIEGVPILPIHVRLSAEALNQQEGELRALLAYWFYTLSQNVSDELEKPLDEETRQRYLEIQKECEEFFKGLNFKRV